MAKQLKVYITKQGGYWYAFTKEKTMTLYYCIGGRQKSSNFYSFKYFKDKGWRNFNSQYYKSRRELIAKIRLHGMNGYKYLKIIDQK